MISKLIRVLVVIAALFVAVMVVMNHKDITSIPLEEIEALRVSRPRVSTEPAEVIEQLIESDSLPEAEVKEII